MRWVIVVIWLTRVMGTSTAAAQKLTNEGKEFWVGYGHHQYMETNAGNTQDMVLYFSAEKKPAHVIVTVEGAGYREEYDVPAHGVIQSKIIPKGLPLYMIDCRLYSRPVSFGGTNSEGVFRNRSIHIVSTEPVVAYAHIYGDGASGAAMLLPVETWGYTYQALGVRQIYSQSTGSDCFSWVYVIAAENNTRIRVVPSAPTRSGREMGVAFETELQRGEIYQLMGAVVNGKESYDLTGTTVSSIANGQGNCFPVAVFTGSSRTEVSCLQAGTATGDNMMQQAFPMYAWGTRFLTAPTSVDNDPAVANTNIYRIIVKDPDAIVKKNGMQLYGLNGLCYEYQSSQADYIEADQPVMVAQYIPSEGTCDYTGTGSPEMIYLSPMDQATDHVSFLRINRQHITENYLTLIVPDKGLDSLWIDGKLNAYNVAYAHPHKPGYSVVVKRWNAAQAQCVVDCDSAFTAITYGLGKSESYGYNAGTGISNLSGMPVIRNVADSSEVSAYTCVQTPVALSVYVKYQPQKIQWLLSALAGAVTPAEDVIQILPVATDTVVRNGVTYYKYTLPQPYRFTRAGVLNIPVLTTHPGVENCDNTEQIPWSVSVKDALHTAFAVSYEACTQYQQVVITGDSLFTDGARVNIWQWQVAGLGVDTAAEGRELPVHLQPGSYSIKLLAADTVGCLADTLQIITLTGKPAIPEIAVTYTVPCAGNSYQFTDAHPQVDVNSWSWSFSDSTGIEGPVADRRYDKAGIYTVQLTVTNVQACSATGAVDSIVVYPLPAIDAGNYQLVPAGTRVQLNASTSETDPLRFFWSPAAGLSGDTVLQPSLYVLNDQVYTLTATNVQGCQSWDTVSVAVFKKVLVPDVFTPNGDGINDVWIIPNLNEYEGAALDVYNRYGQVVYHSGGYAVPWNGTANGRPLAAGVYYYIIQLKHGFPQLQGSVTILR